MKNLRLLAFALLLAIGFSANRAFALNPFEQSTQTDLIVKLKEEGFKPMVDKNNDNVIINKGDDSFWITIKGLHAPMYYTINLKGYIFSKEKDDLTVEQRREIAMETATLVNSKSSCKVTYDNGEVNFYMPLYSSSPADVAKSLETIFTALTTAKQRFNSQLPKTQEAYIQHQAELADAAKNGKDFTVVEQVANLPMTNVKCSISGFSVRVVDGANNEVVGYDKAIRKDRAMYIQESVNIASEEAGIVNIGVKIYNPQGKLIVPFASAKYTTINNIEVKKNKKGADYELAKFGFDKPNQWEAGEYRIEFVINDNVVRTGTFTIL